MGEHGQKAGRRGRLDVRKVLAGLLQVVGSASSRRLCGLVPGVSRGEDRVEM
jgi:hypothetical protein